MKTPPSYCCVSMKMNVEDEDYTVIYNDKFKKLMIPVHRGSGAIGINHCPWCGAKLA